MVHLPRTLPFHLAGTKISVLGIFGKKGTGILIEPSE
jgi:hypothetical protein